jgi:hypothetical protein
MPTQRHQLEAEKPRGAAMAGAGLRLLAARSGACWGGRLVSGLRLDTDRHGVHRLAIRPRSFVTVLNTSVIPLSTAESRGGNMPICRANSAPS